ncbi:MAG TPA: ankyrin repeat domain-containing protein, partial [Planctomycetota bacterium]|nr:ankyrin repeat domain-containing protein [Planctomycetota bacterium]
MRVRKLIPPTSIILFLILTLAGTYYVRLRILEKHMAAAMDMGDNATIVELIDSFPCPVNAWGRGSVTPLHWAARSGRADLIERLLAKGADVNTKNPAGYTPLRAAAYSGRE